MVARGEQKSIFERKEAQQRYCRVFAVGVRCGHLISERFHGRDDAEKYRQCLVKSDPSADTRIEEVNVEGRAI